MRYLIPFIILLVASCQDNKINSHESTVSQDSTFKTICYDTSVVWIYRDNVENDTLFRLAIKDNGLRKAKDGHWIIYFDKGFTKKAYEATVKNGQEVGLYSHWRRNGSKWYEGSSIGDLDTGYYRQWYPNNQLSSEAYYRNDSIIGTVKYFFESGKLKSEIYYVRNNISKKVSFDKDGNITNVLYYNVPKTKGFSNFSKPIVELEFSAQGELINAYKHYTDSTENKKEGVTIFYDKRVKIEDLKQ